MIGNIGVKREREREDSFILANLGCNKTVNRRHYGCITWQSKSRNCLYIFVNVVVVVCCSVLCRKNYFWSFRKRQRVSGKERDRQIDRVCRSAYVINTMLFIVQVVTMREHGACHQETIMQRGRAIVDSIKIAMSLEVGFRNDFDCGKCFRFDKCQMPSVHHFGSLLTGCRATLLQHNTESLQTGLLPSNTIELNCQE